MAFSPKYLERLSKRRGIKQSDDGRLSIHGTSAKSAGPLVVGPSKRSILKGSWREDARLLEELYPEEFGPPRNQPSSVDADSTLLEPNGALNHEVANQPLPDAAHNTFANVQLPVPSKLNRASAPRGSGEPAPNEDQSQHAPGPLERYPGVKARIITDNGPQFIARDFKEFIRIAGLTHVKTSPYYPQSNGKIERWHQTLKAGCLRPGCPLSLEDAQRLVEHFVTHYNTVRLHSAIGYITPADSPRRPPPGNLCCSKQKARCSPPKP